VDSRDHRRRFGIVGGGPDEARERRYWLAMVIIGRTDEKIHELVVRYMGEG
jgi:hypothetical protein